MEANGPRITVIGCGPGAVEYLTLAARQAAGEANVLGGSQRLLDLFPNHPGKKLVFGTQIEGFLDCLEQERRLGKKVAVLVSGDPGLWSLGEHVRRRFGRDHCLTIPGISSVQVAFARLGLSWTDARLLTAHGRLPSEKAEDLAEADKLVILGGTAEALSWSADLAEALQESHRVFLCKDLTLPDEAVSEVTPEGLRGRGTHSLIMIVFVRRSLLT